MNGRDDLTGLLTRPSLLDWLTHALAVTGVRAGPPRAAGHEVQAAMVDIQDFAGVNVAFGERAGDEVLRTLAARLRDLAGQDGVAARVGGDAFALGVRTAAGSPRSLGDLVHEVVATPVEVGGRALRLASHVSVTGCEAHEPPADVIRRLELALSRARAMGRSAVVVADRLEVDRARAALALDLGRALVREELLVHYLPIVTLAGGEVIGVEALARWDHDGVLLDTHEFLDLAQKTGRIVEIGRYVIERACLEVVAWTRRHPELAPLRLAVNVSLHQLLEADAVDHLAGLLERTGLDPNQLCLELSEDSLSELGEAAGPTLEALKRLGLRLSVDDFGTGASSLVALQRHRFDELKIDRSFVAQMDQDPDAAAIVRGVVRLARSLGLELVAEGVERPAQEQMLASLRCHAAQGWLYARPGSDLDEVVGQAQQAASASLARQPVGHEELWTGMPTALSAARFVETVFESAPIGMVMIDHTGRHLAVNPAAGSILGHPVPELLARTCWEMVHPLDLQTDLDGLDSLFRGERTSYVVEQRVIGADGDERWVEVTVSGLPGDGQAHGQPTRLLRQVRSIEEDRQAGADAAVLRSIIEASPDAVIITDGWGRCTHWNPAAADLFGWSASEMAGAALSRIVPDADHVALARMLGEVLAGGSRRWSDATWTTASGSDLAVDVTFGPIRLEDDKVLGIVAIARDVTDQRAADRALREAHGALEARAVDLLAANDRLGAFAATLSHDLLQPVAALDGFLMLLDRHATELTDEHRDWLGRAIRGKVRIAEAIGALHRSVSPEEVELTRVPLGEVVQDLLADLPTGSDAGVIEVAPLPTVLGDPGLLAQVFANLLQNALRYRSANRPLHISIDSHRDDHGWLVTVTDTGRGIEADDLAAVFERGVRGRSAQGTEGTGTGLATVRALAQRMGGDAWAEAHDGGARLCVRLRSATR